MFILIFLVLVSAGLAFLVLMLVCSFAMGKLGEQHQRHLRYMVENYGKPGYKELP